MSDSKPAAIETAPDAADQVRGFDEPTPKPGGKSVSLPGGPERQSSSDQSPRSRRMSTRSSVRMGSFKSGSYEEIIAQIGSGTSSRAFDSLDPELMARDSKLLAERLANMDKGLLKPTGKLMTYWDFFTLGALFFTATITPYEVCLMWASPMWKDGPEVWLDWLFVSNILIALIFYVDIGFNFFLPYKESIKRGGGLVKDHKRIACHYLRSWFVLDFISVFPIDLCLMGVDTTGGSAGILGGIRLLRLARLVKLAKILRASRIFSRWENRISISYGNRQLIMLAVGVLILLHWLACLLGLLAQLMAPPRTDELHLAIQSAMPLDASCTGCTPDLVPVRGSVCYDICLTPCEVSKLAQMRVGSTPAPGVFDAQMALVVAQEAWPCRYAAAGKISPMPAHHGELWVAGLYVAMIQLGGGVGSIVPENLPEYIVFWLCIFAGSVAWAGVVGTICAVLTTADPASLEFRANMDSLNYFLADMDMPEALRVRAREYLRNKRDLYKKRTYPELLNILSPELRIEVVLRMSGSMFEKVWWLRDVEKACMVELSQKVERAVYAPREKVPAIGLNILMRGVCAKAGNILTPISTWGEDVIVTAPALRDKRSASALTYAEIASLSREAIDEAIEGFPESARMIKNAAMKIAMQRAIVVVSEATKAVAERRANPGRGANALMNVLLQGADSGKGAQLDGAAVIPLLMGRPVIDVPEGEYDGAPGAAAADETLAGVSARLKAQEGKVDTLSGKLDEVLALLKAKSM